MNPQPKHKCDGQCYDYESSFGGYYGCSSNGKYHENGQYWCGVHAPSIVKAREEKRATKFKQEQKKRQDGWDHARTINELGEACLVAKITKTEGIERAIDILKFVSCGTDGISARATSALLACGIEP